MAARKEDQYSYGKEYNHKIQTYRGLQSKLLQNVCILYILYRHPVKGRNRHRRMLCTNSYDLLNSVDGKLTLGYRAPKGIPPYDPKQHNLITTWDILMQDYRNINMDECYLNYEYPVVTQDQKNKFWLELFNKTFYLMSTQEKMGWMWSW